VTYIQLNDLETFPNSGIHQLPDTATQVTQHLLLHHNRGLN